MKKSVECIIKYILIQLAILLFAVPSVYRVYPHNNYSNAQKATIVVNSVKRVSQKPLRIIVTSDSGEEYKLPPQIDYEDIKAGEKIDILYVEGIDLYDEKSIIEVKKGSTVYKSKAEFISERKVTAIARFSLFFVVECLFIFIAFLRIQHTCEKYYYKDRKINKLLILDVMTEQIYFFKKEISDIDEEFKEELTMDLLTTKLSKNKTPLVEQQGKCIIILYGEDSYDIISKQPIKFNYDDSLKLKRYMIAGNEIKFDQMIKYYLL